MAQESAWPGTVIKTEGVDAVHDLRCVAATSTASTYNAAQSTLNVRRICDWMANTRSARIEGALKVSRGSIAINDTLGERTQVTSASIGTLSTRTNATSGILTLGNGHGLSTAEPNCWMSIVWSGGSVHYAKVSATTSTTVTFSYYYAYYDAISPLPAQGTAVTAYRIVSIPDSVNIICGGGWAQGQIHVNRAGWNAQVGSFMWIGDAYTPMMRLLYGGNKLLINAWGYPYVSGSEPPTYSSPPTQSRALSAVHVFQVGSFANAGHHNVDGAFTGFRKAIWFINSQNHTDHFQSNRLVFLDCITGVYNDNAQGVNHNFELVENYGPPLLHSCVFDYYRGGRFKVGQVGLTNTYGGTVLRAANANPENTGTGISGAYFDLNSVHVDRTTLTQTSMSTYRDNLIANGGSKETFTASSSSGLLLTTGTKYDTGQAVWLTNSGGGLPTGVSAGTIYYAINVSSTTCRVATSRTNAFAGTQIAYTDAGTGTHSIGRVRFTQAVTFSNSGGSLLATFATAITHGRTVRFNTGTTLPTGLTADTTYYLIYASATTGFLATTQDNALDGIKIAYTDSGSGSHCISFFNSYFRLIEQDANIKGPCRVQMNGSLSWSSEDVTSDPPWYNVNGEYAVSATPITDAGYYRIFEVDIDGLDLTTARKYAKHAFVQTTASGTNYALTATPAALNFGTTDPVIVTHQQGDYVFGGWVRLYFNGFTAGASRTVTLTLRRTTATAADLSGGTTTLITGAIAAQTGHYCDVKLPEVIYRPTSEDVSFTIFGSVDSVSGDTGTLECSGAQIWARRLG